MSKNQIQAGAHLDLTAPAAKSSGDAFMVGGLLVVAVTDIANGVKGACACEGVFELAKDGSAYVEGEAAFWDDTAKSVKKTGAGYFPAVTVVEAAGGGATKIKVKLKGFAVAAV